MQIIRRNFELKLLSLVLAILGWAYFRFATNPVIAARFDQQLSVPIVSTNLPDGYIAHITDKEAIVTVATKRGEPPVKPDDLKAVLDLSNKTTGVYNVPVQLVAPNLVVQSLSPASVSLTVERIEDRSYPVTLHYVGQTPQTGVVLGGERTTPNNVSIHGPAGSLAQIVAVRVDVPVPGLPKTFDEMVRPLPVNAFGQEVADVAVDPELIRVRIDFVAGSGAKGK